MRREFFPLLYDAMLANKDIFVLTGDLGFVGFDRIRDDFPARFVNVGAAEQTMLDVAVGLAQAGMIPVCYSITPFLIYRGWETLRTYVNHEIVPVKLVGSGRDKDYEHDGISHWADDVPSLLGALQAVKQYYPSDTEEMKRIFSEFLTSPVPAFLSLKR